MNNRIEFRLIWSRIILLLCFLAVTGWLSLATFGFFHLKKARNFDEVRFVDVAFPWRWEKMRVARGDFYINWAMDLLEGRRTDGSPLHLLRVGVEQSPDNTEGRIMLAQIYGLIGRSDLAITLLRRKIDDHLEDETYLGAYISLLFNNHEDEEVERFVIRVLGEETKPTERNLLLAIAGGTANFNRGNYDRAQDYIDRFDLTQSRPGMLLQARLDWEQGQRDPAIDRMEKVAEGQGSVQDDAFNFLIQYLWETGQHSRALQTALIRYAEDPLNFYPRLRLIYIYHRMGDREREDKEADDFIRFFGHEEPAMRGLIDFAGAHGRPELAHRLHNHMEARGMATDVAAVRVLEAHVVAGEHDQAVSFHRELEDAVSSWTPLVQARWLTAAAAAFYGAGNTERGEALLRDVLSRNGVDPQDLLLLSERLQNINQVQPAREILRHIHQNNPLNQEALAQLILLDLETGRHQELVRNLGSLLTTRKPPLDILETARARIGSDMFLFQYDRGDILQSLDETIARGRSLIRDS